MIELLPRFTTTVLDGHIDGEPCDVHLRYFRWLWMRWCYTVEVYVDADV